MATIEYHSTRNSAPPRVSDAFVGELRTGRATGIVVDATYRLHSAAELRR